MFVPNQQVVCCDDNISPAALEFVQPLIKDKMYTVRDVVPGININGGEGEVTVYLVEITNSINPAGIERGYNAERFAPLAPPVEEEIEEGILVGAGFGDDSGEAWKQG